MIKSTGEEFEAYCESGETVLSDVDYGWNPETNAWDIPKIEWDRMVGVVNIGQLMFRKKREKRVHRLWKSIKQMMLGLLNIVLVMLKQLLPKSRT